MVRGRQPSLRRCITPIFAATLAAVTVLTSCQGPPPSRGPSPPRVDAVQTEPVVRVRIVTGGDTVTLAGANLAVGAPGSQAYAFAGPVRVTRNGTAFVIADAQGRSVQWPAAVLEVSAADPGVLVAGKAYPGKVVLHAAGAGSQIDAVNHVPIETYLPGVLEHELYAAWPAETFVAQAIAARSYAIAQQAGTAGRHYDLESTTASQVYGGRSSNPKILDAVRRTRGQALVWNGRVLTAYFSASSGGVSQDGGAAFPDKRPGVDIPPLQGRSHGWGKSSHNFQWSVRREVGELSRRLAAWGQKNKHPVAGLGTLARIAVVQRSGSGRPALFQLTDTRGQTFRLAAEQFRFACNADAPGLPKLAPEQQLKSSFIEVRITGPAVAVSGRGHGHGVGLDQWAARDMAAQGYNGQQIVSFFYPGAQIQRLY